MKRTRHKLTCKASSTSVGPLSSNHIHRLTPAAGLSQVQTGVVVFSPNFPVKDLKSYRAS